MIVDGAVIRDAFVNDDRVPIRCPAHACRQILRRDAGALQQSNVGITLTDDINNFTPSCDAILDASRLAYLPQLLRLARSARSIINLSFIISILYNIVGLYISVKGDMEPMIAAILMPVSTLSIILITTGASSIWARHLRLSLQAR